MSGNDELSDDEVRSFGNDEESSYEDWEEELWEDEPATMEDYSLFDAVERKPADAAAVRKWLRHGASANAVLYGTTPLIKACARGFDQIIRILLSRGADPRWRDRGGYSAILQACRSGHLSTVQLLINHDSGLLEIADDLRRTPLFYAIINEHSDIVRFLLDSGANVHQVDHKGETTLMTACQYLPLDSVRLLLATGVDVEAPDGCQQTALHSAARWDRGEIMLELILQHNANIFAVDKCGRTPFDSAFGWWMSSTVVADLLLERYGNKLTQDHGRLAFHELLKVAEYSFAEDEELFHPPLNPLRIILPLGQLTVEHLRTLLHSLDPEVICTRDYNDKLPIHIACRKNAPVEVLAFLSELDPAALHIADSTGALPIHWLCGTLAVATDFASVRYLVEQGGVGTLAARNQQGAAPLHVLCGSTNPQLGTVQYLIQSFPGSVAMRTYAGEYPFMMAAAAESSSVSLNVIYELVRANPGVAVPE